MKIEEAIEVDNDLLCWQEIKPYPDVIKAIKLGIEALKRVKWHKKQHLPGYYELLPGETEPDTKIIRNVVGYV